MPLRTLTEETISKAAPLIAGLFVNFFNWEDLLYRIIITSASMLVGALVVHFFKPYFIKKINKIITFFNNLKSKNK